MHITVNPIVLFTVEFFTFLAASTDGLPTETARLQGEKGYEWHAHLILNAEGIYSRVFRFLDIYSCKQTWFCFEKKKKVAASIGGWLRTLFASSSHPQV